MSLQLPKLRIIISGGGTGGHIFPAIAIANTLMKMNPHNEILFVGANGKMEMEKVPAAGFNIVGLDISGLKRELSMQNLLLPLKILKSILKAKKIINEFKPDVAIGVGGFASGPLLYAASSAKIPTLIQEQNSYAGITNKILSKKADSICVAYEGMEKFFPPGKIIMTGNPVREEMTNTAGKREAALVHFGLNTYKKTILIVGGSLGARTINESVAASFDVLKKNDIQVIWQTGKFFAEKARSLTAGSPNIYTAEFIQRMDLAYAAADVIISRAGASSVSELALVGKPVILVPSPNVAEDHQTKNALALTGKNAALMVSDNQAMTSLISSVISLLNDVTAQKTLTDNIGAMAVKDSAGRIGEEIYRIVIEKNKLKVNSDGF